MVGVDRNEPAGWKYSTPDTPGLHAAVTPENSPCRAIQMFRLNLAAGERHVLSFDALETITGVVSGSVELSREDERDRLGRLDAFYAPARTPVELTAQRDSILYIGAAECEGHGAFFVRHNDPDLPLGDIHQIHGKPPYEREVFMALNAEVPASRLIAGWTFSRPGGWTSWPPHQHENDLEEVYT